MFHSVAAMAQYQTGQARAHAHTHTEQTSLPPPLPVQSIKAHSSALIDRLQLSHCHADNNEVQHCCYDNQQWVDIQYIHMRDRSTKHTELQNRVHVTFTVIYFSHLKESVHGALVLHFKSVGVFRVPFSLDLKIPTEYV